MEQKYAIVTGGTRGIGRAISLSLAKEKIKVFALFARNRKAANSLIESDDSETGNITPVRGDLTRADELKRVVDYIKNDTDSIDFIIHSAASGVHRNTSELTAKHLKWTYETNVISIHNLLAEFISMIKPGGRVVGLTSTGSTRVIPYYAAVGSSKAALEALFRHYAYELAPKGISINLVCPGMVLTDVVNAFPDRDTRVEACMRNTPSNYLTKTDHVAELVRFLCLSDCGGQIIGQTIVIDGGKTLLS